MTRKLINPSKLHPAPGFSHITVAQPAVVAYIAGQTALEPDFTLKAEGLAAQTEATMRNIEIALKEVGASWEHVVRRTIYTLHPTEYETITAAIEKVQGSQEHPAQTILGVTGLAVPGLLIEIEVTVHLP